MTGGILKGGTDAAAGRKDQHHAKVKATSLEKTRAAQWTFTKMVESLSTRRWTGARRSSMLATSATRRTCASSSRPTPPLMEDGNMDDYDEYINGNWQSEGLMAVAADDDVAEYSELLKVGDNPLTVTEGDAGKKRYKAYGKWLQGKSLFKHQPVD